MNIKAKHQDLYRGGIRMDTLGGRDLEELSEVRRACGKDESPAVARREFGKFCGNMRSATEKHQIPPEVAIQLSGLNKEAVRYESADMTRVGTESGTERQLTARFRPKVLARDEFKCVDCGRSFKDGAKLDVHHIIPLSKGGTTVPNNLRTLCDACHHERHL